MRDSRGPFDEETQLALRTGIGGRLKGVAAGEHEGDDHGGEVFAEHERNGDREERDRIDAHIAMARLRATDQTSGPRTTTAAPAQTNVRRRVGTEDVEHRPGDEPDEDDENDRELSRELTVDRGMARVGS